ncbi:D-alanyl-D-alanine carboxypeptidase/D-alanyl-D-alanine endopeptidase [Niabella ginsengisoli]|uniref:D-alanyl-D-alanine carboxypeptidase/D-alanyl-D-alanine-endopeptidase n=1 Tax=Niabella ginsengisoli TaxID=522298 RepID=A0ABS9SQT6_9BACT|nr:D-alanyl-D-alanine carboxypeptidase/D-alanyl-D-alanine-endopeptidase [Niabella ginsengisoli]MCH5600747.1 D-alanyl-D-alanine carboxypeptidase/D-alanyl-D-alanine-endopeptidase [Niabella ginsengisoli]
MKSFNNDEQLKFASAGFYVIDAATGKTVFEQNAFTGLAPASTEKVVTAATALDVLGKDFTYETKFGIVNTGNGKSLYIQASGDPTLGSWRWDETKEEVILQAIKSAIKAKGITKLESIIINTKDWIKDDGLPARWTWEDIGQYYGAGSQGLNWRENQFDLIVKSGSSIGSEVTILRTKPYLYDYKIISEAKAAGKETGDESALYYPSKGNNYSVLKGTIPAGKSEFVISGSIYDPARQFAKTIINELKGVAAIKEDIVITGTTYNNAEWLYTHTSPTLSKIVYWFLRKSVNLYGEAFLRTVAFKLKGEATTEKGVEALQEFWKEKGVDPEELHLYDGSGLSPQNRITPHAEVSVLNYAKSQTWFPDFYEALPLYNDMKMKSGTINRVKGFTGYQKSKSGKEYIFSMLINNYNGSQYSLIRKMYKVLDILK